MDQEKREKLTDLLFELSKSQEILATPKDRAGYFRKLEEIYYNCDKDVIFILGSDGKLKIMVGGNNNDMGRNQGRPDF